MIITKKEFKDAVKKLVIESVNFKPDVILKLMTPEELEERDRDTATKLTNFYDGIIKRLYQNTEEWEFNEDEFSKVSDDVIENMELHGITEFLNGLLVTTSLLRFFDILDIKKEPQEQEKEFDVEEILKEAGGGV